MNAAWRTSFGKTKPRSLKNGLSPRELYRPLAIRCRSSPWKTTSLIFSVLLQTTSSLHKRRESGLTNRAAMLKQWVAHHQGLANTDIDDLTRFDEAIDQAVTESVAHYTKTITPAIFFWASWVRTYAIP